MKKKLLLLGVIFSYLSSFGQIGIIENFENGIPAEWTSSFLSSATQACSGQSVRDNLYSSTNASGNLTSPNILGQSNATDLTLSFDYKIVNWFTATEATPAGWGSFLVEYSTDGGTTWINVDTIDDSNHVVSAECVTKTYTVAAADLPEGTDFQLRLDISWASGDYFVYYDNIIATQETDEVPSCDALLSNPVDGATDVVVETNINWSQASGLPSGYFLSIGTTSGSTDVLDNEDVGFNSSYDLATNLLFDQEYFVTIVPYNENGDATGCEEQSFTTESAPPQGAVCEDAIPVTEPLPYVTTDSTSNYEDDYSGSAGTDCGSTSSYLNGDDVVYEYTPTEDTSVDIILSDLSGNYAGMFIYSSCEDIGTACQDGVTNGSSSGDMEIQDYVVTGGETYYILISTWATPQTVDYTLSILENTCINPTVSFEVVGNCMENPEFFVEVDVTDIGDAEDLNISDGTTTETIDAPELLSFGPYANGTDVNITVNNNQDVSCFVNSPSLTQEFCTETYIDCAVDGPLNVNYCYINGEDYEVTYISTDGTTPLNLNVNSGNVENSYDEFIVIDSDGTTELYNGYGNAGDLTGLSFQSTGAEITVRITPDSSNSCESSSNYDPIDYTVSCATCINPQASFEVVADCAVDPQFLIEVEITDLGSATDLILSDGDVANDQTVDVTGTYTFGPYVNGDLINISVLNADDINCEINSGDLTQEYCSALNVDCAVGPQNASFCYGNDETNEIVFTSNDGSVLNLTINAGQMSTFGDDFIILDSDGTTELYNGTGDGGDLTGLTFQSTGDNITVRLISNGFTSCESNDYTPIDVTVACATCVNPEVTYFKDCDPANQEFSIDVEVTDLGSAGSVEISDDQGSAPQTLTTVGIVSFGPYAYTDDVVITTENLDDANCTIVSAPINSDACPPIPCIEAEPFCSDEGLLFPNVDNSTGTTAPPGIDYGCLFTQPNPVWYFLQIQDPGDLSIEMVQNTSFDDDGNPTGTGLDVDFIAWGPFDDVDSACNGLTVQNQVPDSAAGDGCSYSADDEETFGIENAQEGEVYVLLITNYSGQPGFITLNQTGGDGSTDCSIIDENTTYACGDDPVNLTSQYPTALAYVWYMQDANGDFVEIPGETTMDLTVTEGGIYRLDTFNNAGELQQEIFTVIYSEGPDLSNVEDTVSFCGSTSTTLDATIANPGAFDEVTYQWSDENGPLAGETQATLTVTEAGLYTVDVSGVVLDGDGNPTSQTCESSITIEVTTADFTVDAGVDQSACDAEEIALTAAVTGADTANATYDWVDSAGNTVGNTESINVTDADVYTVTVTIDGCVASDDVEVIYNDTPSIDLGGDISTCDIDGIILDATPAMGTTGVTFEWTFNGTSISETGAIVNAVDYGFGTYEVEAYTNAACSVIKSITVSEADYTVNLSADQELVETVLNYCEGEESVPSYAITFTANIDGIDASLLSYAWYKNGSLISDAADEPTYTANYTEDVAAMDTYSVEVSLDSCVVNSEALGVDLTIAPYEGGCVISEGLSPGNLDGMNDCLDLSFLSDRTGIKNIQIFSRYGRVVYEKSNYVNDWCGQDKDGDVLQTATYFYVIEFTSPDPVYGKVKKGWIYLNRESNN
ncbi:MAG: gliding motility-associated C-terminal domain-containing protein [Mesonia sp.]|uniref:gliding motility-associated C-terminal domain-containing protein n=2 Tax=Mesonia sp. TaxID=1960830 RepID=UPI003F9A4F8B